MRIRKLIKAGARFTVPLLFLLAARRGHAHDPGLSAASLELQRGQLVATLNFAPADATRLPKDALEVMVDGRRVLPTESSITHPAKNDVQLRLRFPLAVGQTLRVRSAVLDRLPYGHRQYLVVNDDRGRVLLTQLLDAKHAGVELNLDEGVAAAAPSGFAQFLHHGVMHILTGYDHLLFVTALALAAVTLGDLLKVVGMFTVAHSVTLTLSVFNLVRLPSSFVEPIIAASIVFVALTNVCWPHQSRGRVRLATAFGFGLFHGLGFAGGLLDAMAGLPGMSVGVAIIAFSLGVELGHQAVVLPTFGAMKAVRTIHGDAAVPHLISLRALRYGSAVICAAGSIYLIAALR